MSIINIREIKKRAIEDLRGKWGQAAFFTLLFVLVFLVGSLIPFGQIFIGWPLSIGYILYFLSLVKKEKVEAGLMFRPFDFYGKALLAYLLKTFILLFSLIPSVIVVLILYIIVPKESNIFVVLGFGWLILIAIPIYVSLRLSMFFYILIENPQIPVDYAISISWKMMQEHVGKFFLLNLSFILWFFLALLSFGIGFLWFYPYYRTSVAHFYLELKNIYPEYSKMIDYYSSGQFNRNSRSFTNSDDSSNTSVDDMYYFEND